MRRFFLNACAAAALVLGGWGGVLAGAACGHAHEGAGNPAHECCRARTKGREGLAARSSKHTRTKSPATHAAAEKGGHCHSQAPPADESPEAARADAAASFARQSTPCGHCAWRSGTPPAAPKSSEREAPRRVDAAPSADVRLVAAAPSFSRETSAAPARAAPPGPARLYVLISCFLI